MNVIINATQCTGNMDLYLLNTYAKVSCPMVPVIFFLHDFAKKYPVKIKKNSTLIQPL